MPEKIVDIVDQDHKPYEQTGQEEEPLLVLTGTGEKELRKIFKSQKFIDAFKEMLKEESGDIEDEHEAPAFVPNTKLDYNAMHQAAIDRQEYYNLVFENLMRDLERHEENPREGESAASMKQRVIEELLGEDSDLMEEIQDEIKTVRTQEARDKKRREYKREAGIDIR